MTLFDLLIVELAAIDLSNRAYWRTKHPRQEEKLAYFARQEKRSKVISELLELKRGTTDNTDTRSDRPQESRLRIQDKATGTLVGSLTCVKDVPAYTPRPKKQKYSMVDGGTGGVCSYCKGKGHDQEPRGEGDKKTWVRRDCPLCKGMGRISIDDSSESKDDPVD